MTQKYKWAVLGILVLGLLAAAAFFVHGSHVAVLQPKGIIASKERVLMITAVALGMLVIVPVFALTFFIVWRYREGNTNATYSPEVDHNIILETIWWVVPCIIIGVLSVITWRSSQELDPFKPLSAATKPVTIQVVALPWKWLFIYPEQQIATLNYIQFPSGTPINFEITADAPMNSLWIPQLGGQIYAMSGMSTELHLMADSPGEFQGSSANLSGRGFAGMHFVARSSSQADFTQWVQQIKQSRSKLSRDTYDQLAKPSENNQPTGYSLVDSDLYDTVIAKYMAPGAPKMQGMDMGSAGYGEQQ